MRLFGNIFAGGVLVHTMLGIAPFITFVFLGLELFVGAVQALIFTMLTLVFLSIAVTPHHAHDDRTRKPTRRRITRVGGPTG